MYLSERRGNCVETISMQENVLAVENGRQEFEQRWDFDRAWVQIRLLRSTIAGHPSQLILRSHGKQVSVGDFLIDQERREVARALRSVLANDRPATPIILLDDSANWDFYFRRH
ncbi:MAG: putative membrane protein [Gammaproteobacteria bacterium]